MVAAAHLAARVALPALAAAVLVLLPAAGRASESGTTTQGVAGSTGMVPERNVDETAGPSTTAPLLELAKNIEREDTLLQWSLSATTVLALLLVAGIALVVRREQRQLNLALGHPGSEQRRLDAAVRERTATLAAANANLTRLSRHSLQALEQERWVLSSELHDRISSQVAAMLMNLHRIGQTLETTADAGAIGALHESVDIARRTFREVCDLALDLRPTMLDQLGVVATLQWYAREMQRTAACSIEVLAGPVSQEPSASIATAVYRIVQESVSNALRHAHAERITIEVRQREKCLELRVRDDGIGFDFDERSADGALSRGLGLLAMRERAIGVGGALTIRSAPGSGTQILLVSPLTEPEGREPPAGAAAPRADRACRAGA